MSSDFRLHYDRLRDNDPTMPTSDSGTNEAGSFYDVPSHARNLCLVWLDGKRQFLSYAYLVGGVFTPGEELNEITLNFSIYLITLTGYRLEALFVALFSHSAKQIMQIEQRYVDPETIAVTDMIVQSIK